jgi:O-antigen ligase
MVVATIAVEAYALSYIFNSVGLLPDAFYIDLDLGQHIEFYGRFIEFSLFSLSSLVFLVPFIMTALLIWPRSSEVVRRIWLWIALVLGLAVISMSARRALMLVLLLAPVAAVAGRALLPDQRGQISWKMVIWGLVVTVLLGSGVFLYLNYAYEIEWEAIHWLFVSSFSPEFDVSATIRLEQFEGLIQEWRRRPIFGKGIGTTLEALRMSEQPWSYELQYVAMLAQTGLVGVTCFGAGLIWIGWQCIRIIRAGDELARWLLPVCVGTLCFLAATGTNQYIGKYDYLWVIFLPLAFVNMHLLNKGAVLQSEG